MRPVQLSKEHKKLYLAWFDALYAVESLHEDALPEEKDRALLLLEKTHLAAKSANVPGIK